MPDNQWIAIYSSTDLFEIDLVKGMLADNDIESVVVNKRDSVYLVGEIELFVNVKDAFIANQIINTNHLKT